MGQTVEQYVEQIKKVMYDRCKSHEWEAVLTLEGNMVRASIACNDDETAVAFHDYKAGYEIPCVCGENEIDALKGLLNLVKRVKKEKLAIIHYNY